MQRKLLCLRGLALCGIGALFFTIADIRRFTVEAQAVGATRRVADFAQFSEAVSRLETLRGDKFSSPDLFVAQAEQITAWKGEVAVALERLAAARALRPRDFLINQTAGLLYETAGQTELSLSALAAATSRAPFYAEPRWLYGNALWRSGAYAVAEEQLNRALRSDAEYEARLLELIWQARGAEDFVRHLQVFSAVKTETAVDFLLGIGRCAQASQMLSSRKTGTDQASPEASARKFYTARCYREAYFSLEPQGETSGAAKASVAPLQNGNFTDEPAGDAAQPFGWHIGDEPGQVSIERLAGSGGNKQLRVVFAGNTKLGVPLLEQIIPVLNHLERKQFTLNFSYATLRLKSGSLPSLVIRSLRADGTRQELGRASCALQLDEALHRGSVTIALDGTAEALQIALEREGCAAAMCPIYGELRLADFTLSSAR